jgi:outer membrane receptor protein involved in Fe transport
LLFPNGKWSLNAWARNLENYGAISGYLATTGATGPESLGIPLPPRTFGVRATVKF